MDALTALIARTPHSWIRTIDRARWRHRWIDPFVRRAAEHLKNRDMVIQAGVGKGLRINVGRSAASFVTGIHESNTQSLLVSLLRDGMVFYDIGANVGFCSLVAARLVGATGRVVAFEPLPENLIMLRRNALLNGFAHIAVVGVALGRDYRDSVFATSERPTWGCLRSVGKQPAEFAGEISVPVRPLDGTIAAERLPRPDVMKIDVEGAELDALAGAAQTLQHTRPIIIAELHGTNANVVQILAELRYQVATLDPAFVDVTHAHWNAVIVAAPPEKVDMLPEALKRRMRPAREEAEKATA